MSTKIYALLVGIIDYEEQISLDNGTVYFPKLQGCVNDARKVKEYLRANYLEEDCQIKELYNSEATKENICKSFLTYLGQAKKGESVLFYYSGHGTQEFADACFTEETDRRLESLVCYYKSGNDNFLLADKELRYLIHQLAQAEANITLVMDCCHSGDVTRNAEIVKVNYGAPIEKRSKGTYTFSQRQWKDFIFATAFGPQDLKAKGVSTLLPEGNHIAFSASESNEFAYEIAGEGIFTKQFTNVLNATRGVISNQTLFDRLSLFMKYAYEQKPRIYTPKSYENLKKKSFLAARDVASADAASVYYNPKKGWILNRGALSGIYMGLGELTVFDSTDKTRSLQATIAEVKIDHTILIIKKANLDASYTTNIEYLSRSTLKTFPALSDALPRDSEQLLNAVLTAGENAVGLVQNETDAEYTLQHLLGMFYVTKKNEKFKPVAEPVSAPNFQSLADQLKHISSCKFVYDLPGSMTVSAQTDLIDVEYSVGSDERIRVDTSKPSSEIVVDKWNRLSDDQYSIALNITLTNKSQQPLYVAVLYLDVNFAIETFLLEPAPYLLNPGDTVILHIDQGDLVIDLNKTVLYYNYERYKERIRIIVNAEPFQVYYLKKDPLPEPPLPGMETMRGLKGISRSIGFEKRLMTGWYIVTLDIVSVNPLFNKIGQNRLKEMLEDKVTAPFAEGLYFDPIDNHTFEFELKVKPEIVILTENDKEQEIKKDAVVDIANWWSRRKRNDYYLQIAHRFPSRTRIVSEGDSWFQHPLVYDTIDHLSKLYAIRCVAAAGDTLSNYLSGQQERGEYFLDVIREIKPSIFLISGGGNDILGPQFKDFLVDKLSRKKLKGATTDRSKFLKDSFSIQIDKIMGIYNSIFGMLGSDMPAMTIIVHGYDYPIHLDSPDNGWLGRYMIEKGISNPADRRAIVRYILDEFNTRLMQVCANYSQTVRYLDLRNTVNFKEGEIDQWYDEIHPNADGFQRIALKFIKLIEAIRTPG